MAKTYLDLNVNTYNAKIHGIERYMTLLFMTEK